MKENENKRAKFSGSVGYVLSAAGASVGLGNIWRFPYLAAKYGGGIFILVYLVLLLTFGYSMFMTETTLGRRTGKSAVGTFRELGGKKIWTAGGWLNAAIPVIILPYYSVIGGWVMKYGWEYIVGNASELAGEGYFSAFISDGGGTFFWFILFLACTFVIILGGVKNGVERTSSVCMPLLVLLSLGITVYSVTRSGALAGVKYLLVPDFGNFSLMTVVAALGQMFYSLSIAMGILYTYGSYMKKDVDIERSARQVELFDTFIAVMAGLMIIPAVFSFSGGNPETLNAGPSLMFITLPKVFASVNGGAIVGAFFFVLVFFAAVTSSIALLETAIATLQDELGWKRKYCCLLLFAVSLVIGSLSALGYGPLSGVAFMGMAFLDFFDFLSNSLMMPLAAIATCLLVLLRTGFKPIEEEIALSGTFRRRKMYIVFIRYFAVLCILLILLSSVASAFGWISI